MYTIFHSVKSLTQSAKKNKQNDKTKIKINRQMIVENADKLIQKNIEKLKGFLCGGRGA